MFAACERETSVVIYCTNDFGVDKTKPSLGRLQRSGTLSCRLRTSQCLRSTEYMLGEQASPKVHGDTDGGQAQRRGLKWPIWHLSADSQLPAKLHLFRVSLSRKVANGPIKVGEIVHGESLRSCDGLERCAVLPGSQVRSKMSLKIGGTVGAC